ncbi:RNA polymerase sigma-70 factor [Parapusillimonas sp. SGNA-6]|uniref:RNA polymerase sigma-70 factor n=1 Tax=Parapedobacter sp. SGR-10 TaxID=2710879 RepID=UPI0013D2816E|nr:RNA polymerase sigma-70 factor [Parapedobacter sp. SGR-10]NGF57633.1 RNA polymerase sigma-70 factor [Parapedobacter sp. SGR-10]NGM90326.1 RNA polymerase sigma-70 factor [Parapusillimonas sp. SGNA-6]
MKYTEFQDNELLLKLSDDDQDAFDEIYRRYWGDMFQSAYNLLREREACMDIVQEIFIWFWEHRHGLNVRSLKPYLSVAVKFKVANYIKKGKVRSSFFDRLKKIEEPYELVDDSIEVKEMMQIINRFTNQLPDKCREIFLLSRQEHLSNKEIAERLGISVKTVENQMTIALKKMKSSLAKISPILLLFL